MRFPILLTLLFCCSSLFSDQNLPFSSKDSNASVLDKQPIVLTPDLAAARTTGESWLLLIDRKNYNSSWDQAAATMKLLVDKKGWNQAMTKLRQPLGSVSARTLKDVRTAQNPPGAPAGDYVVLVYDTKFSGRAGANEMVILIKESDGKWRVMSYFAR